MDKAKDEAISKLIAGQEKMGKEITEIKVDIADLKQGQKKLEADVTVLKADVSDLKQGQNALESMMFKMMEEMTFIKKVVINIENSFKPQVKTLFEADKVRQHETTDLKQICREQEERLEDHEIRINRLEKE